MVAYQLIPNANDQRNVSQGDLKNNFTYLQTSVGVDHNFTNNTATSQDGYHKTVHLVPASTPANNAGAGQVYSKTGTTGNALHFMPSTGSEVQLSLFPIRAVCNFDFSGALQSPSFNVSSIGINASHGLGTNVYKINFTTALPSANYVVTAIGMNASGEQCIPSIYPGATYGTYVTTTFVYIAFTTPSTTAIITRAMVSVIGG